VVEALGVFLVRLGIREEVVRGGSDPSSLLLLALGYAYLAWRDEGY